MAAGLVLGAVSLVGAAFVLWWALAGGGEPRRSIDLGRYAIEAHRDDLRVALARTSADDEESEGPLARLARRVTPEGWTRSIDRRLLAAGSPAGWTAERILAIKGMVLVATAALVVLTLAAGGVSSGLLLMAAVGALMFFYPEVRLKSVAQDREKEVQVALAETIDQLSIIVQAGLSIDAAIVRAARSGHGPLAAELTRVAHDVRAGIPRTHALLAMAERVSLPELRQVVTAIVQAESLGVPMASTLQIQAEELREKRRQRAEEQALKLPVKILFPTVLCILPALFVVVLGPAVFRILDSFGS
jgi:tight adherence protein C